MDIREYHQRTKHRPEAYAKGPESIDWEAQPEPFRSYEGCDIVALPLGALNTPTQWHQLWQQDKPAGGSLRTVMDVACMLEISLALSAWKQYGGSSWSLRVNPSSGNLHPTECYVLASGVDGLVDGVYHYRADLHALELRCRFASVNSVSPSLALAFTSVHWREAWKYGERAFRYCQHDVGHALASVSYAAATLGVNPADIRPLMITDYELAALTGIDRTDDYPQGAEAEHPDCLITLNRGESGALAVSDWLSLAKQGSWTGTANVLDKRHFYEWDVIEEAAQATRIKERPAPVHTEYCATPAIISQGVRAEDKAAQIIYQRRSAQAFDQSAGAISQQTFFTLLDHTLSRQSCPPWNALPSVNGVQLFVFVHKVEGLKPGLYALIRDGDASEFQHRMREQFVWESVEDAPEHLGLYCLLNAGTQRTAANISCQQAIAGDSAFSLGMLADMRGLEAQPYQYRQLFWQAGAIGQSLYLEAEAEGLRGTGIGCYYDDFMHDLLGLSGESGEDYQVLYHFTVGVPLTDHRITTWRPYQDRR